MHPSIPATPANELIARAASQNTDALSAIGSPVALLSERAIAALLDIVVISALFPVLGMWAAVRWGGVTSNGFQLDGAPGLFVVASVCAVGFLYLWLGEGLFGATLGKTMMRLRVRNLAGGSAGLRRSLLRNLFRAIDGIGVYLVGLAFALTSRTRQRLGDRVAGTVVVQVETDRAKQLTAALAAAALLFTSLVAALALHSGAPAAAASVPRVTRAELGTGHSDTTIVGPSDTFTSGQPDIVCVWQVAGVATTVPVRSVWIADDVGSAAPPNTKIDENSIAGSDTGWFTLSAPPGGWPPGKYHLDIYIGESLAKSLAFTVTQS
jgi:uncharacterized RDD family membrane protein YckC